MTYPQGINFRNTAGYASDDGSAGEDHELENGGIKTYPRTSAQSEVVGWEDDGAGTRDRNSGNDRRIAGMHFPYLVVCRYRLDLPSAGTYNIELAAGDPSYGTNVKVELFDDTTSLGTISSGTTSTFQRFKDATNTEYTNSTWPSSQTSVSKTFSTTKCRFTVGVVGEFHSIAHLRVSAAGGGGGGTPVLMDIPHAPQFQSMMAM